MTKKEKLNEEKTSLKDAVRQIIEEKHIGVELVHKMIKETIQAAYKKRFMTDENCVVEIADDSSSISVFSQKTIVADDELYDSLFEITLTEAKKVDDNAEIGDDMLVAIDPKQFNVQSITTGKQRFRQNMRDVQKNKTYSDFKAKEKEVIVGYVQSVDPRTKDVYMNLGNGNVGILPRINQSPVDVYKRDEKFNCYIDEVRETDRGVEIILSRSSGELVRRLLEFYVPEIADGSIEIYKIVRKAGYKTKVAVYSSKENLDPVGTCVGIKGNRIQNVIKELNDEKIDIVPFNEQIEIFIANALTPAQVKKVRVADYNIRKVYAETDDRGLALAIGKEGLNVQLANKLTDWLIDIKTEKQFKELDLDKDIKTEAAKIYDELFENAPAAEVEEEPEDDGEELLFETLPLSEKIKEKIRSKNIKSVEEFAEVGTVDVMDFFKFTEKECSEFLQVLNKYVELVDYEE